MILNLYIEEEFFATIKGFISNPTAAKNRGINIFMLMVGISQSLFSSNDYESL